MIGSAEEVIVALKRRFRVSTDQGLADKLKVGRSTVASWRSRGHVPARYARFADTSHRLLDGAISNWSSEEKAAATLALMRLHRGFLAELDDYSEFLRRGPFAVPQFVKFFENAHLDMQRTMEEQALEDPWQSVNLIVYDEFFAAQNSRAGSEETGN